MKGQDERVFPAVGSLADNAVASMMTTSETDHRAGRFSHGIAIGTGHKGRGYATEAVRLLTCMFAARHPFPREI
ncbi:GNAT family N-acetyltransferase [Lentzea sp. HUAS12]|nr:GNAT family N-acetyltransferase [Lentzea sp. HUAS12]